MINPLKSFLINWFGWLAIPAFFYLGGFLLFPAFNIIDDGASLLVSQRLLSSPTIQNWSDILIERQVGRLRPVYHLSFFTVYALFGFQPFWFWFVQYLVLTLTLVGAAVFLYQVTKRYWLSALAPLVMLAFPSAAENFYRLGTAEPKQFMLWVWLLVLMTYVYQKGWTGRKFGSATLLFGVALFTKETSMVFSGLFGYLAVWQAIFQRKKPWVTVLAFVCTIVLIVAFFFFLPRQGSYSQGFQLNLDDMKSRLMVARLESAAVFFPLSLAIFSTGLRLVYQIWKKRTLTEKDFVWSGMLLSQLVVYLVIGILPWQYQLPRYYYPIYLMGFLYIAVEIAEIVRYLPLFKTFPLRQKMQLVGSIICASVAIQMVIFQASSKFTLSLANALSRAHIYVYENASLLWLLFLVISFVIVRIGVHLLFRLPRKTLTQLFSTEEFLFPVWMIVCTGATMIFCNLFWGDVSFRVNYVTIYLLIALIMLEIGYWMRLKNSNWGKKISRGPALSFVTMAIIASIVLNAQVLNGRGLTLLPFLGNVWEYFAQSFDTHQVSYSLIHALVHKTPEGEKVFVSSDDYEVIFEIGLYASNLKQRPVTIYTNNQQLIDDVGDQFTYLQYVEDPVAAFLQSSEPKQLLVRRKTWEVYKGWEPKKVLTPLLSLHVQPIIWEPYEGVEYVPAGSVGIIPREANWVRVQKAN